jgi:hypothetical protein
MVKYSLAADCVNRRIAALSYVTSFEGDAALPTSSETRNSHD